MKETKLYNILYPGVKEQVHLVNDGKRTAHSGGDAGASRRCLRCGKMFPSMHKLNRKCSKCTLREERGAFGKMGEEML